MEQKGIGEVNTIICPHCGHDFSHISKVYITPGRDSESDSGGIRDTVSIHCYCEYDPSHKWIIEIQDHKGNVESQILIR